MSKTILERLCLLKAMGYKFISDDFMSNSSSDFKDLSCLNKEIKSCNLCQLRNNSKHVLIGYGDVKSKIMFVSYEPSFSEDESGEFLNGVVANHLCELVFTALNLKKGEFYFSSILKCKSTQNANLGKCISLCKPYIMDEIELIKPRVVVLLGESVFYSIFSEDEAKFDSLRGSFLKFNDTMLMPTYSNLKLVQNPSLEVEFLNDLAKIKGVI